MAGQSKPNKHHKRGKRGQGRLFKKSKGKAYPASAPTKGTYYLTYTVKKGLRKTVVLKDESGDPITDLAKAEEARERILAPLAAGDDASRLRAAQAALRDAEEREAAATLGGTGSALTLADAWDAYTHSPERPDSGIRTLRDYRSHWSQFTKWMTSRHADAKQLCDVAPAIASEYAAHLTTAGVSSNTYNKHTQFLRLLFRVLGTETRISVNPFGRIKRKTLRTHSRRELTIAELQAIIGKADGDMRVLLLLGASTGLRLGDCCTLQWGEVDLTRGIIRRVPNKTSKSSKPVIVGIPPELHALLTDRVPKTGPVFPQFAARYRRDSAAITKPVQAHILDCGIDVHAPETGKRITRDEQGHAIRDKKTGKVTTEDMDKRAIVEVGFHSLRHTWVSLHTQRGTPMAVVQASVGHANPSMTAHYTHISEDVAADVSRALPSFSGDPGDDDSTEGRAALHRLADTLPAEEVRKMMGLIKALEEGSEHNKK